MKLPVSLETTHLFGCLVQYQETFSDKVRYGKTGCSKTADTRRTSSEAVIFLSGSTTLRFAWIHMGSIGLSQGLFFGKRKGSNRIPCLFSFTARLCSRIHWRTALLLCQVAWSQTITSTRLSANCVFSNSHSRYWMVKSLQGLPSTKRSHTSSCLTSLCSYQWTAKP